MPWNEGLSDELKNDPSIKDYTDLSGLVKSHIEAQKMIGGSVRIPSEDASAEDKAAFYAKITDKVQGLTRMPSDDDAEATASFWKQAGVPEDKDGYAVKEGISDEDFADLKALALDAGLTKKQFEKLTGGLSTGQATALEAANLAMGDAQAALFKEWGAAKADNLEGLKNLLKGSDAPAEMIASLEAGTLDASFMSWASKMANAQQSEGNPLGDQKSFGKKTDMISPLEAESQLNEMFSNKEHPYWQPSNPAHAAAKLKVTRLQHMANGDTPPQ